MFVQESQTVFSKTAVHVRRIHMKVVPATLEVHQEIPKRDVHASDWVKLSIHTRDKPEYRMKLGEDDSGVESGNAGNLFDVISPDVSIILAKRSPSEYGSKLLSRNRVEVWGRKLVLQHSEVEQIQLAEAARLTGGDEELETALHFRDMATSSDKVYCSTDVKNHPFCLLRKLREDSRVSTVPLSGAWFGAKPDLDQHPHCAVNHFSV